MYAKMWCPIANPDWNGKLKPNSFCSSKGNIAHKKVTLPIK